MDGRRSKSRLLAFVAAMALFAGSPPGIAEEPMPAAVSGFTSYVGQVEARLDQQHGSPDGFLAREDSARARKGEPIIEKMTPSSGGQLPGALLHHWRGTAFAAGASAGDFERLMKDFPAYPQRFSPQVVRARVVAQQGDQYKVLLRVRQHHVITVVMDTAYDILFGRRDGQQGYSIARSTRISEIKSPGTSDERALTPEEEHGFLWRMNTYWSYEEKDGGLYMQIESVTLTRSIPTGLGWVIGPFVESIPRESLEFTLRAASDALRK
jgi:hypothetical protein